MIKDRQKFNPELLELCRPDDFDKSNLLNYKNLQEQAEKILKDDEFAKHFTDDLIANSFEDQVREYGKTVEIRSCRYPQLLCLKNSIVHLRSAAKFTMHMNKFNDFCNRPMFLSQAPLEEEFTLYWQTIIQENVMHN